MSSPHVIELKNVNKTFFIHHEKKDSFFEFITSVFNKKNKIGKLQVLNDISFSIKKGEMIGIIGINGSGKTTLLRAIAKIITPDSGSVITSGKIIPFLELGTGFNGELTAKDNIILNGVLMGFSKQKIKEKIGEIIKFAELEKFLDTKLKNFSAGMVSRLAFSIGVQVNSEILLVDEILSVGDVGFQKKSFNEFMKFRKSGKTILYVSHDVEKIKSLCDRVMWIHNGMIMNFGDPAKAVNEFYEFLNAKNS